MNSKISDLVDCAIAYQAAKELNENLFENAKASLLAEASVMKRLVSDTGTDFVELEGTKGKCKISYPKPAVQKEFSKEAFAAIKELCGDAAKKLFFSVHKPIKDFKSVAKAVLTTAQMGKLIPLATAPSSPRVSFEAAK